jgi:hypothetical protein
VGNIGRIVKLVPVFDDRLLFSELVQYPVFCKPGDVADFPKRRIDDGEARANQLLIVEINDEIEGAGAKFAHDWNQVTGSNGRK